MTTGLVVGNVIIDQVTAQETFVTGMAADLYNSRKAAQNLADPNLPKTSTIRDLDVLPGVSTMLVDDSRGWSVGDTLVSLSYIGPDNHAATVKLSVTGLPSADAILFAPPMPAGAKITIGTKLGFQGTAQEWKDQQTPQLVKQRTNIAKLAVADATAIIGHFKSFALVHVTNATAVVDQGGLQKTPNPNNANTPTVAPDAAVSLPVTGTGTIT